MPSKSPAQHKLMEAVAHDPKFAAKVGIPQSVGQEFAQADEAASRHTLRHPTTGRFIPARSASGRVGYGTRKGVIATQ